MSAPSRPTRSSARSEEHTSELQSPCKLVCRLLLEKKNIRPLTPDPSLPASERQEAAQAWFHTDGGSSLRRSNFFFFNDTATTEIYTLSLHDALPTSTDAFVS